MINLTHTAVPGFRDTITHGPGLIQYVDSQGREARIDQ